MHSLPGTTLRASAALFAGAVAAAGLALAFRGGDPSPSPAAPIDSSPVTAIATPSASSAVASVTIPTDTSTIAPSPTTVLAEATTVPLAAAAAPTPAAPPQAATPTLQALPSLPADLPKYTDVAVLALAAEARLPSGRTFRECVERPPSHERWPVPVHLYYQGGGRWMVETHISEVQVVFDETSASFAVGNFQPPNPGCR